MFSASLPASAMIFLAESSDALSYDSAVFFLKTKPITSPITIDATATTATIILVEVPIVKIPPL